MGNIILSNGMTLGEFELKSMLSNTLQKIYMEKVKKLEENKIRYQTIISILKSNSNFNQILAGNTNNIKNITYDLVKTENYLSCFDTLFYFINELEENIRVFIVSNNYPTNFARQIDTLIYASKLLNCPELNELKELINFKYGNNVIERAEKNMNNLVDGKILMKFNNLPLSQDVIVNKLVDIKNRLGINTNNNAANNINNNNINVNNSSILTQSFPMFSNHSSKEIELPKSNFSLIKASFTNFDINEEIKKPKHKNVVRNSKTLHLPDLQNIQNKEAIYNDVVVPEVGNLAVYPKNNVNNNENLLRLQRRQEQLQKKKELEAALAQKIHRIQELQKQLNQPKFSDKFNIVANRLLQLPETAYLGLEHEAQISDFNIIKELGKGGFATVYLAVHKLTQAQYAIKAIKKDKIKPKEMLYFRREIEIMYKIHHPNIVKLFGHFEDDSNCYLIME